MYLEVSPLYVIWEKTKGVQFSTIHCNGEYNTVMHSIVLAILGPDLTY